MTVRIQTNCTCCLPACCAGLVCCAHFRHTISAAATVFFENGGRCVTSPAVLFYFGGFNMSNTAEIARAMATTMENAAIPMYGKKLRLPDRSAIIALFKELRRLFFLPISATRS